MKSYHKGQTGKQPTRLTVSEPQELMEFLLKNMPSQGRNNIKSLLTHRQVEVAVRGSEGLVGDDGRVAVAHPAGHLDK